MANIKGLVKKYREKIKKLQFYDSSLWLGTSPEGRFQRVDRIAELVKEMDYYGIKKGIVSHIMTTTYNPIIGNEILLKKLKGQKSLQASFILPPPGCGEIKKDYLDKALSKGMVSVRLLPKSNRYLFKDWLLAPILKELEARRIPLFLWIGQVGWQGIYETCHRYSELPIIAEGIGHHEFLEARNYFPLLAKFKNLHLGTHNLISYLGLDDVVKRFGAERLIFGTNFPLNDPDISMMMVAEGEFSWEDKKKIAHVNLESLINGIKR
ncbi:hypothetical protein KKC91_01255 [bacterium]|nr:hypothetical protein [bacterium]